jgi:phosphoribosylformylglycinamidine cyclo-ligase
MYQQSGVNIEEGYRAVSKMKKISSKTTINGVLSGLGSFGSMFSLNDYAKYIDPILIAGTDGVGTKLKIAFTLGIYNTIGIDAVAMCVNDILCHGAQPVFFLDYLACGKLDADKAADIVSGVGEGCLQSECALVGGETAEMSGFYKDGDYDIAGFTVGVVERAKIIDGSKVEAGDILIGLDSSGFHSNGYSLINKVFTDLNARFSDIYSGEIEEIYKNKTVGEILLTPTKIYVKPVISAIAKFDIHGIANITGGGFIENIPRMFKKELTAVINKKSLKVTSIFDYIIRWGTPEHEMYNTFNMGTGMVIAVSEEQADSVVNFFTENNFPARIIGKVSEFSGEAVCIN